MRRTTEPHMTFIYSTVRRTIEPHITFIYSSVQTTRPFLSELGVSSAKFSKYAQVADLSEVSSMTVALRPF